MYADLINDFIHKSWSDLKISKLREFQNEINNLSDNILLDICLRKVCFVDSSDGGMELKCNDLENEDLEKYSIQSINYEFKSRLDKIVYDIIAYSHGLKHYSEEYIDGLNDDIYDSSDISKYMFYVIDACKKYDSLFSEFDLFIKLVGDDYNFELNEYDSLIKALLDMKHEREDDKLKYDKIRVSIPTYKDLNFSPSHVINKLITDENTTALEFLRISGSNGMHYLQEHREAQEYEYSIKEDKTTPDDIVKSVWNSGWVAPDGTFYGCPDLKHVEFNELLYNKIRTPESDAKTIDATSVDRKLEILRYIKLSEGRWLFSDLDFIPTKQQLQAIIRCQERKYKTSRTYYEDRFLELGVIKSKLNNKEIYPDED